jgi:hypothetical protein
MTLTRHLTLRNFVIIGVSPTSLDFKSLHVYLLHYHVGLPPRLRKNRTWKTRTAMAVLNLFLSRMRFEKATGRETV